MHEGTLRIGDKTVFGRDNTINTYLDIEIGVAASSPTGSTSVTSIMSSRTSTGPSRTRGSSRVRCGSARTAGWAPRSPSPVAPSWGRAAYWRPTRSCGHYRPQVRRGRVPARVLKDRQEQYDAAAARRAALEDIARKTRVAAQKHTTGQ